MKQWLKGIGKPPTVTTQVQRVCMDQDEEDTGTTSEIETYRSCISGVLQGPYTFLERVGPVNYSLHQHSKCTEPQHHHITLLKKWFKLTVVSAFAVSLTDAMKCI